MNTSLIVMIFFFLYTLLIIYTARKGFYETNTSKDFFVANHSLGTLLSIATFVGTWFSAASFLGLRSSLYIYGVSGIIYSVIPWFLGAFLMSFLVPTLKKCKVLTFPELLYEIHKSFSLRLLLAFLIVISYILYITMQIKGFGIAMELLLNIPYRIAIFLVYLYILYTTFGGLYSIARTDVVNASIKAIAAIVFGVIIIIHTGGIINIWEMAKNIDTLPIEGWNFYTPKGGLLDPFCRGLQPPMYLFTSFFGWGLGLASNPQYIIRIISAKNEKTARRMIIFSLIILTIMYSGMIVGSIGLRTLIPTSPSIKNVDEIIPTLFLQLRNDYTIGVLLIGIIAASVSTANAELLLIANSITYDILPFIFKRTITNDEKMLFWNRIIIAIAGTFSLILSFNPPEKLIQFGGNIWGIFTVTAFIPLYTVLFAKKPPRKALEFSSFVGIISYIVFWGIHYKWPDNHTFLSIHPAFWSFLLSSLIFLLVIIFEKRRERYEKP
ncbi:Na+/panthothenate symporter [Thermoanaerobacter sp. YS13]|uniref:sodium:solute symporter family protein n=1 Tax=Thermoanaerobacter sp. YS13 TaxID=1511746 RepID=UPI000573DBC0|nr:sodium:solute symporter family protein [Thermoanaerobacter sp. YS13]KHO62767.1 Na+/panthothenate symporter [Thermoanaerobacter sp. YS13]